MIIYSYLINLSTAGCEVGKPANTQVHMFNSTHIQTYAVPNALSINQYWLNKAPYSPHAHYTHISHRKALIKSYQPPFLKWSVASELGRAEWSWVDS